MKTLILFLTLMSTVCFGQLPTFTDANVKTYFDTASVATIDTFAVHASQNYTSAWQNRFNFSGKQIFLTEFGLTPSSEKAYFVANLGKVSAAKAAGITVDFRGFHFTSDGDNNPTLTKIDTQIHTDWMWVSMPPYVILASFWITKDIKK